MNKKLHCKEYAGKCCLFFALVLCSTVLSPIVSYGGDNTTISLEQMMQQKRVTINSKNKPIETILQEIKKQTGISFMLKSDVDSKLLSNLSLNVVNQTVESALTTLLSGTNFTYSLSGDMIVIVKKQQSPAKKVAVTGKVLDVSKKPIAGATVIVKGTSNGAITDATGAFALSANTTDILEINYVGKLPSVYANLDLNSSNVIIEMADDVVAVDDVVVTGYFTRKKESYTGATTTFTGKELRNVSTGNLLNSLSMLDPSFTRVVNNEMGSNPNAIPEFEIRGAGSLKTEYQGNPNMPTFMLDGFEVSAQKVFDLDPNRVRSMTILKDAAATAIYGSRAANGVVVIETEAPKMGELRVSYNGSLNFEAADLSCYDLMNAKEKLQYEINAGLFNFTGRPSWIDETMIAFNERSKLVRKGNDTDWIAIPVRNLGVGQKHAITAEGGDNTFRYALDLYYSNKIGVMKGSKRDNYGGSIRLQYNYKKLKFTNYTSFDHVKSVNSPYGNFSDYTYYNPYFYPYNEDGGIDRVLFEYTYYDLGYQTKTVYNELYNATLNSRNDSGSNNFLNNFAVEYDILSGLKLKANLSLNVDDTRSDVFLSSDHTSFLEKEKKGSYQQNFSKIFSYDVNVILSYFKQIKRHTINAGLVYNLRESVTDATGIYAVGYANDQMDHIAMGTGFLDGQKPSGSYDITRLIGAVGNIGYSFADKYLLDASIRMDGSSLYGANNRWGTFWSVGLGWNIAKENFLKDSKVVDLLKLRGSIGTTGGQNFNPYQAMSTYSYNSLSSTYGGYIGAILKAFGNDNLRWQKIEKQNVGVDFGFFNSRISGNINYYNDLSKDVLIDVSMAPSLGFSSYKENLGKVRNSGVELSLKGSVIRDVKRGLRWELMFNAVHNKNAVLEINKALSQYNNSQDGSVKNKPTIRYQEGLSMNTIWVNQSLGIDPATGEEIFLSMNGEKVKEWDAKNYKPLGCTDPTLYGTFGTVVAYKGWELNASFYYKFGGDNYNQTLLDKIENVNPNQNGDRRILYDRWTKPGDIAKYKKVSDVSTTKPTSRFIERENLLQLQSVAVSYDFSSDKLRKSGIERLRVSAIGNELFNASTVKMERGISYPFARTFSLSAQLTF